jgi:LmbE family N-acetylglucosaminyl deacetylase
MTRRILAIGAHPDDIEVGCSGLVQSNSEVHFVILSQGEKGADAEVRSLEAQSSARLLNASLSLYDLSDTLISIKDAAPIIEKEIENFSPTLILTMAKIDTHQDHKAVYEATKVATRDVHCTVLSYIGPSSAEWFHPTWFVPITPEQMEKKLQAVMCHKSQKDRSYLTNEYLTVTAKYWAMVTKSNHMFVEPYETIQHWEN